MVIDMYSFYSSSFVCDGYHMCQRRQNGATPLDLATDDTCRKILEHHAAVYATVMYDPAILVAFVLAHCATLSASGDPVPKTALSLRAHQLDPSFLWAPPAARAAVFAWARNAFQAQLAATTQPFGVLPDDCAGDVLDFFGMAMTRFEALHVTTHCSSPEACAWVREVVTAAVAVAIAVGAVIHLFPIIRAQ